MSIDQEDQTLLRVRVELSLFGTDDEIVRYKTATVRVETTVHEAAATAVQTCLTKLSR